MIPKRIHVTGELGSLGTSYTASTPTDVTEGDRVSLFNKEYEVTGTKGEDFLAFEVLKSGKLHKTRYIRFGRGVVEKRSKR